MPEIKVHNKVIKECPHFCFDRKNANIDFEKTIELHSGITPSFGSQNDTLYHGMDKALQGN